MVNLQRYFEQFHDSIRIDLEMSRPLREKRDIILDRVRSHLRDSGLPGFKELLQGSYAPDMKTGVKPLKAEEYDIDIGLRFSVTEDDYSASEVRGWVLDAVEGHTDNVEDRGPCVRVIYADGYHVDLVSYAVWDDDPGATLYRLAHRENGWRTADPPGLLQFVRDVMKAFEGTEDSTTSTNQFRRAVRYVRRWIDENLEISARPCGLAVIVLAAKHLRCTLSPLEGDPNDAECLRRFCEGIVSEPGRLSAPKPTPEYEDLLGDFADEQVEALQVGLRDLASTIVQAQDEVDPVEGCRLLRSVLGSDFPVPRKEDTARTTRGPAIVPSSASG